MAAVVAVAVPRIPTVFEDGDYGTGLIPWTLPELSLLAMKQTIIEKEDWQSKIDKADIIARWTIEAEEQQVSKEAVSYILDELRLAISQSAQPHPGSFMVESGVDGVFVARKWIANEVRARLLEEIAPLEAEARGKNLWHPGSNDLVLDTVHPSLFCLIDNFTSTNLAAAGTRTTSTNLHNILSAAAKHLSSRPADLSLSSVLAARPGPELDEFSSKTFQWLPSDFRVTDSGKVEIESYINNLHPAAHAGLYDVIAGVFEQFVPMFESVISAAAHERPRRVQPQGYGWYSDYEGSDGDDDAWDNWHRTRLPKKLEIPAFAPRTLTPVSLKNTKLQVIVKIASIELTPENPNYPGGTWHVEATQRENIVATGIYYIQSENIANSRLAFRAAVQEPQYEQNDDRGVAAYYNLANEGPLNQSLGSVGTTADTCLCFPNILQHCVQPFSLDDKTKNGSRKILVFFLIDPNREITSTATVLPQQREWYEQAVKEGGGLDAETSAAIHKLLASNPAWPMTVEEAKQGMEALMEERAAIVSHHNEIVFEREFSLCEH